MAAASCPAAQVPVIDLGGYDNAAGRTKIVEEVWMAMERWGLFQVVNHGIPLNTLHEMLQGANAFHQDAEEKAQLPLPDPAKKVSYGSNLSRDATRPGWKHSLIIEMAPEPVPPEDLPLSCRDTLLEYANHVARLGKLLFQCVSEALGLAPDHLERLQCTTGLRVAAHYYPPCLEPDVSLGTPHHSDPCFLTVLLQDQIGGLQVLHQGNWVDVHPLPGALVVNVGDLLQLLTNDKIKSAVHRVLTNSLHPRLSVACLFSSYRSKALHGPIKELLSVNGKSLYREVTNGEYLVHYMTEVKDYTSALANFRI